MNFLFLSKLLPLFIYPLGLSCVLLLIGLFLSIRKSRFTCIPILLSLILLLTAANPRTANYLLQSLEKQYLPLAELPTADAIVVLGGSTRAVSPPRIVADLNEHGDRIFYAAKLYKEEKAPLIILSGGRIQWFGQTNSEAEDMAEILELIGIPPEAIIKEGNSLNTHDNATYTKKILEEKNINSILLVTSAFHMPRAMAIFRRLGIEPIPAPTDFLVSEQELAAVDYSTESKILSFLPEPNSLARTTLVIKEYIGTLVYRLKGWL
ncbi:MAG: YdcF family protein [Xenococcaceae cyanobacterium MO_167.B52]|nr:YdcF family protein [Xenococcaceae cyanobacterium MO_167.B52]